jgi:hypothetical protein
MKYKPKFKVGDYIIDQYGYRIKIEKIDNRLNLNDKPSGCLGYIYSNGSAWSNCQYHDEMGWWKLDEEIIINEKLRRICEL